jgi:hypothetical protein
MVDECAKVGMKPLCDHPHYCKSDPKSTYIGQDHHMAHTPHRNADNYFPSGWNNVKGQFPSSFCTYTAHHGGNDQALCTTGGDHSWQKVANAKGIMCAQAQMAGDYDVWYQGSQRGGATITITCDNIAGGYGYSNQQIHLDNVKQKCGQSRDAQAYMYILNTHGSSKYECLWTEGTTVKGSHYTNTNQFWGTVEYRLRSAKSC